MSGIGIIVTPQSYCAHLYYIRKQMYEWRFYFVITPDLEATNMVVREHYGHDAMQVTMRVRFEHSEITLNIPEDGLVTKEGWRITPLTTPTISRKEVDEYKPGQWIPECELIVQWAKEDQRPVQLRHIVDLIGAKPPFNYIHLNLNPAMEAMENQAHYKAYQQALKEGVAIPLKYLRVLFFGPPRTGKTAMRRRLVGEIQNLAKEAVQASTGTAEHYDVIVKLVEEKITDKISTLTTVITKSKWSTVKALFGKEKSSHKTDLDEEMRFLYQYIYRVASQTESRSPVTKQQSPTIQAVSTVESNPNTSEVPGYELDAKEMEEIEKAFEAFDKVLHTAGEEQLKVLLGGTILMNMVDTGGQPAFVEMLPALTVGPALYLIFFRLNQELKKRYQVQYVSESHEDVQLGESSYTVEEVIFQALSSIACFSCTVPKKANMPNPSHAAMLIGTHKDQLGSDPKIVIKAKDDALQKSLKVLETELFKSDKIFLHHASEDQLMFAIDNMTGDKGELKDVRKRLENIIKQEFDDWPIPASWLMFSIFLRKMGKRTMSLLQCYEIGNRLNVKNTDEALWFLHHCVGVLMHFPEVEEIQDIVICDPQVVFDSVTNLILNSFTFEQVSKHACEKFKESGQFRVKDIQKIAKNMKSDGLSLPKLVKLLEYHNIIAPIKAEGLLPDSNLPLSSGLSPQSDVHQEKNMVYFMPAILRHAKEEELHMQQSSTNPIPLIIHFKCGFVPIGVFCAMIASLVAKRWTLLDPSYGHNLYKNKIIFRINGAYNLTLISKPKWYEIHIACILTEGQALEKMCRYVLETVCDTLDLVISKMRYKQFTTSSPSDPTLYELGFKCPEHPNDDHLVINTPLSEVEAPSQSAKCLWLNHHEGKSVMICQDRSIEGGKAIDLRDRKFSQSFAEQSLVWFEEITKAPSLLPDSVRGSTPPYPEVKDLMNLQVSDWYRLGLALKLDSYELDIIEKNFRGDTRKQTCKMFQYWLMAQPDASYVQLIKALCEVGDERVANSLCKKYGISLLLPAAKIDARSQVHKSTITGGNIEEMPYSNCGAEIHPPQLGSQLPKPELKDLMHLQVSNWHKLGLALGLKSYKLDIIKRNHLGDTESQTCNMFEVWLKTQPDASYEQLIKALCEVGNETVAHSLYKKYAKCSLESFSKDDSKECSPSPSPEQPMECLSSSSSSQYFPSSGSDKRHHVPRGRQSRSRCRSPRHSSICSSKHHSHSPRSHRSPTSSSTSHSRSSKRRTESRSHKQRSKSSSSRRSRTQSPPRRRSRSRSPRHSSSNRHQSRPHSPRSQRRHRRQSHSGSPRRRSHSKSPTSRSTFHSHSSKRRRSKSRSLSPHKQRVKSHSTRRRSRSQSPKSHRRQSHFRSPRRRSHFRSPTSRSKFHSHSSKRRRSTSRSQSPPRKRLSMSSYSPGYSSSSRHRSRSHSPRSRKQPHFWSPHQRSRSRSRTPRNSSCSQRPKRRSKPRSQSPHNH